MHYSIAQVLPQYPFSNESWERHPSEVLERMKYIEKVPPCSVGGEEYAYYSGSEVKDWFKLERARIERSIKQKELDTA